MDRGVEVEVNKIYKHTHWVLSLTFPVILDCVSNPVLQYPEIALPSWHLQSVA